MIVEITFAVEVEDPEALFSAFSERYTEQKGDDAIQGVRDEWSDDAGNLDVPGMIAWLLDTGVRCAFASKRAQRESSRRTGTSTRRRNATNAVRASRPMSPRPSTRITASRAACTPRRSPRTSCKSRTNNVPSTSAITVSDTPSTTSATRADRPQHKARTDRRIESAAADLFSTRAGSSADCA